MAFPSGSAYNTARDIAEGYSLMTERLLKGLSRPDLEQLGFEIDRHVRELRGDQPSLDDIPAIQLRNRRLQRLNSALVVLRSFKMKNKM